MVTSFFQLLILFNVVLTLAWRISPLISLEAVFQFASEITLKGAQCGWLAFIKVFYWVIFSAN